MNGLTSICLKPAAAISATDTGDAIDVSDFTGNALLVLNSSATGGAGQTSNVKLTHCDTAAGVFSDAGIAFDQVANAAASFQSKVISSDGLKKFVKVVNTLAGAGAAVTAGVQLIGKKAY